MMRSFDADRPRWYAVHVAAGKEAKVTKTLRKELSLDVLYLWREVPIRIGRKPAVAERPLMPRYIFASIVPILGQSVAEINAQDHVSTVLHIRGEPLEIPLSVIRELRSRGNELGLVPDEDAKPKARSKLWAKGQRVQFDNPLGGFLALVERDDGDEVSLWAGALRFRVAAERVHALDPV